MKLRLFFLSSLALFFTVRTILALEPASSPAILSRDDRIHRQILSSTVQIAMYAQGKKGSKHEVGSLGLGTLVRSGDQKFLVTHDHWSYLNPRLKEVQIMNAEGKVLLVLDAAAFKALIRYRDGGTMLLHAPQDLAGVVPASVGQTGLLAAGSTLWLARYSAVSGGMRVEVAPGSVEAVDEHSHPPRLRLRMFDGSTAIPGDSGGGVWYEGQLVGNVWANGVKERRAVWDVWSGEADELSRVLIMALLVPFQHEDSCKGESHMQAPADLIGELER